MKSYDLIIVSNEYFPYGQAASNRIVCYATAIAKERRVLYLTQAGPLYGDNWGNVESNGNYQGVEFHYMGDVSAHKPVKVIRFVKLIFRYIKILIQLSFKYETKSIIVVNNGLFFDCCIKMICILRRFNIYNEINETLSRRYSESKAPLIRKISSIYDGFIIISPGIRDYYPNLPDKRFFFLPMLVDIERFNALENRRGGYMLYCSGGNLERDGFLDILKGFLLFYETHPDYKLKVATSVNMADEYHSKCLAIINDHTECIDYIGQVPTSQIPQLIIGSECLFVTPHHKYDTVGFPTKLGEFFASKKPVIISSIPDLQAIPPDCAYIVEPNRPDLISSSISEIVSHPEIAEKTGGKGYDYVVERFTMRNYTDSLMAFVNI